MAKDWHNADIVCAVRKAGTSLKQLSLNNALSEYTVKTALYRQYPGGERIIAEAIGVQPQRIWPSRYKRDGSPKRQRKLYKRRKRVEQATELVQAPSEVKT